jgi:hypothetical protein
MIGGPAQAAHSVDEVQRERYRELSHLNQYK